MNWSASTSKRVGEGSPRAWRQAADGEAVDQKFQKSAIWTRKRCDWGSFGRVTSRNWERGVQDEAIDFHQELFLITFYPYLLSLESLARGLGMGEFHFVTISSALRFKFLTLIKTFYYKLLHQILERNLKDFRRLIQECLLSKHTGCLAMVVHTLQTKVEIPEYFWLLPLFSLILHPLYLLDGFNLGKLVDERLERRVELLIKTFY